MDALTILDEIRVATPCQANWDEMPGDDRVRSCPTCSMFVYNIAAMTSTEAASLIAGREGRLCARLFRRADGTLVTSDCPAEPANDRARFRIRRAHALMLVIVALSLAWTGRTQDQAIPAGPGVTWDDWVYWAAVTLGVRPAPPATPVCSASMSMGDLY